MGFGISSASGNSPCSFYSLGKITSEPEDEDDGPGLERQASLLAKKEEPGHLPPPGLRPPLLRQEGSFPVLTCRAKLPSWSGGVAAASADGVVDLKNKKPVATAPGSDRWCRKKIHERHEKRTQRNQSQIANFESQIIARSSFPSSRPPGRIDGEAPHAFRGHRLRLRVQAAAAARRARHSPPEPHGLGVSYRP